MATRSAGTRDPAARGGRNWPARERAASGGKEKGIEEEKSIAGTRERKRKIEIERERESHGGVKLLRCVPRPRPLRRPATGSKLQPPHHLLSSPAPISSSPFPSSRNLLSPPGFLPAAPLPPPDPAAGQRLSSNPAPQGLFYVHQGTIKADTMADAPAGDAGEAEMDPMLDPTRKPLRSNDQVQVAASATATTCPKPSSGTANKRSKTAVHLDGAALFLNQGKFYPIMKRGDDELVGELRGCFNDVLGKMIEDEEIQNKIDQQAVLYENQRGPFSNVMAMQNIGTRNPLDWWKSYGGRTIDLQRFAKRIVILCASSSGCERNWSAHTQQGRGSSSSVGEEQVEDVEEVEEEFIIDDHDLSSEDEEDATNAANGDGENMGANEDCDFDDDY